MTNPNPTIPARHQSEAAAAAVPAPARISDAVPAAEIPANLSSPLSASAADTLPNTPAAASDASDASDAFGTDNSSLPDVLSTFHAPDTSDAEELPRAVGDTVSGTVTLTFTDTGTDADAAANAAAEAPAPPAPDVLPAPSEETLLEELAPLRTQYPRMDLPALIASDAFRDFGESVGWDSRELTARLPQLIEASRALSLAVEPPVSRVTAAAASHRRPLLSPGQQKDLAAWNRDYPAYRMTELEYFNALGK